MDQQSVLAVGDQMPDLSLPTLKGGLFNLHDCRDKKYIIYMWASWWACREQLPGWQDVYETHQDHVEILSAAIDFQGGKAARPYVEQAGVQFTTVVDTENLLSAYFGFRVIPNMVFVDESGIIRYIKFAGFDIRHATDRTFVEGFIQSPNIEDLARATEQGTGFDDPMALVHFQAGMVCYQRGETKEAMDAWREAVAIEPENWIIRKQIWAIEHPERFYAGEVDFDWQAAQIAEGR